MLAAIAGVAAIGVFGTRLPVQVRVLRWLADRAIPAGFAGWVLYAIPLCAFVILMVVRAIAVRFAAYAVLAAGLLAVAAMGRPRGTSSTAWKAALGPGGADFVHATTWAAYAFLASGVLAALVYLARRPDGTGLRRLAACAGLFSITGSLVATLVS